jgi:hypothetical protein
MAYPIQFRKEIAARWLEALSTGKPLTPPDGGWNIGAKTMLAGVLHFACHSHGPTARMQNRELWERLPLEHREATEETLSEDLHDAISFNSQLAMMVKDDEYEKNFEPELVGAVFRKDGEPTFQPLRGVRPRPKE